MLLADLQFDRNLRKKAAQTDQTEGASFASSNPTVNPQNNTTTKAVPERDATQYGAKELITGTRIIACFIQTSGLPSRIEMAGNDLTFFDDTYEQDGVVKGDTSRLVFTHDLDSNEGFIMEKRASIYNTYDNVLSWYATPAKTGAHNYMFIGRNAYAGTSQRHVNSIHFNIDKDSNFAYDPATSTLNGFYEIEYSEDGVFVGRVFIAGNSETVLGPGQTGFTSYLIAYDGGRAGFAYQTPTATEEVIYAADALTILPGGIGVNFGSPSNKFGTWYGSTAACALPTVENALELLDRIEEPKDIEGRGHFGDGIYFDDITFPDEISFINSEGNKDIEITRVVGFLLKAVKELSAEVKDLKTRLQ